MRVVGVHARLQVLLHMVEQSALASFQSPVPSQEPYSKSLGTYKFKVWGLNSYLARVVILYSQDFVLQFKVKKSWHSPWIAL